jgi:cyclopropane fatty-acyl-phospholipid synthase-like methyltransferase
MNQMEGPQQISNGRMSDLSFRLMAGIFSVIDHISPFVEKRALSFNLQPGMSVVDYGCGPGRYTQYFSRMVGEKGKVFAVDIHELAIGEVKQMIARAGLRNVQPVLAHGYYSGLQCAIADRVFALDVFHGIRQSTEFLVELRRLIKADGLLVIDEGHQPREVARMKILKSGLWRIEAETEDHLECRPM